MAQDCIHNCDMGEHHDQSTPVVLSPTVDYHYVHTTVITGPACADNCFTHVTWPVQSECLCCMIAAHVSVLHAASQPSIPMGALPVLHSKPSHL